ncbi:unnamed protein product [Vicia faba]|uniref:FACT complex subunit n=1 Tax=Vicia faba TaxID=3906 RepID=A0AAV1AYE6_VICFA|nr:unnamed protein product [Vicia faba]
MSLDGIKVWLDTIDIKYYESRLNLMWRAILKKLTDVPKSFIVGGGWEFLNLEATDSESDNSDKVYEQSDTDDSESVVGSGEDEEEEDSDEGSEEEDSDEGSEEEKGKTWEELEREASNADKEEGNESDSEEDSKRRKAKAAFGKLRGGQSSSMPKRRKLR